MLPNGESLSTGEVARHVGQYQNIRAKLPDDQWLGSEVALTTAGLEGHEIHWRSRSISARAGSSGGTMSKAWFITGASSGLGRHLTEVALSEGDAGDVYGWLSRP